MEAAMTKLPFALPLCLTFVACGDPWTPAAGPAAAAPEGASTMRTTAYLLASEGGVIRSPDGRARLIVPPGALMADRELSLGVAPAAAGALSATYEVMPASMALGAAITIEIDLAGEVAWGRRASAAIAGASGWEELPESLGATVDVIGHAGDARGSAASVDVPSAVAAPERARDFVVGALLHGGLIAAVAWEDAPRSDDFCPGDDDFTGCDGASPLGSWHLAAACSPGLAALDDPFETQCPASLSAVELRWQGQ
jgi:hypothetical protein